MSRMMMMMLATILVVSAVEVEVGAEGGVVEEEAEEVVMFTVPFDVQVGGGNQKRFDCTVLSTEDAVAATLRCLMDQDIAGGNLDFLKEMVTIVEEKTEHLPPVNGTTLRTAGAYLKRALESFGDERFLDAGCDYFRASRRKGLEREKKDQFEAEASQAIKEEIAHRVQLAAEAAAQALVDARLAREEAAASAARQRAADADADLGALLAKEENWFAALAVEGGGFALDFTLTASGGVPVKRRIVVREGEDGPMAAARFCCAPPASLPSGCTSTMAADIAKKIALKVEANESEPALAEEALKLEQRGDYANAAGVRIRLLLAESTDENARELAGTLEAAQLARLAIAELKVALETGSKEEHTKATKSLSSLVRGGAPTKWAVWLARERATLGDWDGAESAAASALHWLAQHDRATFKEPWGRSDPKTLALVMGAAAALEKGRLDKALKFLQTGLREDPDSPTLKAQYDGLKNLQRKTAAVDKLLKKGFAIRALEALDEAMGVVDSLAAELGALGGSNCDSYRAKLLTKSCAANSRVRRHEEALAACDRAATLLPPNFELAVTRAAALERDDDYDEATREWQRAMTMIGLKPSPESLLFTDDEGKQHNLKQRLGQCKQLEDQWEKRRDHSKVLELPANLGSLSKDRQCTWLKKQHKKLARKWHPDKANGADKQRAARKMSEVSDAKQALMAQFACGR